MIDHPLTGNHRQRHAYRKRTATETEGIYFIVFFIGTAQKTINIAHVSRQPPAKGLAKYGGGRKCGGTDAIIVIGNLPAAWREIQSLVGTPDIGFLRAGGTVPCTVRKDNDFFHT